MAKALRKKQRSSSDHSQGGRPWLGSYDSQVPRFLDYPHVTCHQLLEMAAHQYPQNSCTLYKNHSLSYAEVDQISTRLAHGLANLGLKKGERVGLLIPNLPQFVFAYFAILKAGGIVVAMNPQAAAPEVALQAAETGVAVLILHRGLYPAIKDIQAQTEIRHMVVTNLDDGLQAAEYFLDDPFEEDEGGVTAGLEEGDTWLSLLTRTVVEGDLPQVSPEDPAIFQYSGGTTGTPKAAVGLHRNLTANTHQFRHWLWNMQDGEEIVLAAIPMFHVYGMVLCLNLAMTLGATLLLVQSGRDLDNLLEEIHHNKPTLFPGVPGIYAGIVNHPVVMKGEVRLDSLKVCISGSAPLPLDLKRKFDTLLPGRLVEGYGLSEAPTATHCNPIAGLNVSGSIGLPLPDVDCRIVSLDDGASEVPNGEMGELVISGPQVMKEYFKNPTETRQVLRDGWLFTGDIASMDERGYFYILDRKKDLIKVGGLQVWPHEVEEVIALHPDVRDVGAAGIPDAKRGESVKAWIVPTPGKTPTLEEIAEWCSRSLSRYKIPTEIEIVNQLPRSPIGKLLRRELGKEKESGE